MAKSTAKSGDTVFREALKMVSPGTRIRESIAFILQSGSGALMCFGPPKRLSNLSEGGVQLDAPCTPQLVYELSKMDGAIILNQDGSRILYANRFLKPNAAIPSRETGSRHRAAERMAKQARCTVVAVSESRASVTLFVHDRRQVMDDITTLLNKTSQVLQTLEKFITALNESLQDLSIREFQDMVTIFDVCKTIQRFERVARISAEMEPYILELGTEGRLLELQLSELLMPLEEAKLVIRDYIRDRVKLSHEQIMGKLGELTQQELLHLGNISQLIGYSQNLRSVDTYLSPHGYRILTQTHRLTPQIIDNLVQRFGTLQQVMRAPKEDLVELDGVGEVLAERIRVSLNLLQNQLALDRR